VDDRKAKHSVLPSGTSPYPRMAGLGRSETVTRPDRENSW
jgi:hypothetical protein